MALKRLMLKKDLDNKRKAYAELEKMWEEILTLQFHDVLPGSSIKEVYDDTDAIYKKLFSKGEALRDKIVTQIAQKAKSGEIVFNMQPFKVNSDLLQGEKYVMAKAPAYGFAVAERRNNVCSVKVADKILENKFFRIKFDDNYEIVSIYDIINGREVLKPNQKGNVLTVYENVSIEYDAWEIRDFYTEKAYPLNNLKKCEFVDLGSKKGIRVYRKFMDSSLKQTILLSDVSPRIDFITDVDWKQENLMLKVKFPVDVFAQNGITGDEFSVFQHLFFRDRPAVIIPGVPAGIHESAQIAFQFAVFLPVSIESLETVTRTERQVFEFDRFCGDAVDAFTKAPEIASAFLRRVSGSLYAIPVKSFELPLLVGYPLFGGGKLPPGFFQRRRSDELFAGRRLHPGRSGKCHRQALCRSLPA